jgi:lipid A 4'-phosphatase
MATPVEAELPRLAGSGAVLAAILATLAGAALFLLWPSLDLAVARAMLRPDGRFLLTGDVPVSGVVRYVMTAFAAGVAVAVVVTWLRGALRWDWLRRLLYVVAVFAVGPGLVANGIFKENWGRARPREIIEFGGGAAFTPPFVVSDACQRNCSFVSGDAAAGFAFLGPALLLPARRRRLGLAAAALTGAVLGLLRMMAGAHFLSDVIFAGLFDLLTAQLLYRLWFPAASVVGEKQKALPD